MITVTNKAQPMKENLLCDKKCIFKEGIYDRTTLL